MLADDEDEANAAKALAPADSLPRETKSTVVPIRRDDEEAEEEEEKRTKEVGT